MDLQLSRFQRLALVAGLLGLAAAAAGLFLAGPGQFFQAYLFSYLFWLELTLGSLAVAMLHYLMGGNWGVVIRQVVEAAAKTLWLLALLFIPLVLGAQYLYPWAQPALVAADPLLQHKTPYLNMPFFILRAVLYFGVWIFLAWRLTSWARQPENYADPVRRRRFQRLSAVGLIVYVLTMSFASIDWLMALQADWYSTIYGLQIIVGQVLGGFAFALLVLPRLVRTGPLAGFVTAGHYRDLGALLLTTVILWAYIAFSQYLIIWYGNIPREVAWYLERATGGWLALLVLVVVVQFVVPFLALLPLETKRNPRLLAGVSLAIIAMRLLEHFWQVAPVFRPQGLSIHWLDIVVPVALGGLWLAAFAWHLGRTPPPALPEEAPHADIQAPAPGTRFPGERPAA